MYIEENVMTCWDARYDVQFVFNSSCL